MRPSQAILALEKLRNSSSIPLRRKGVELTFNDSQTTLDVYQQWILLLVDLGYLSLDAFDRTTRRLWIDLIQADVLDLNNAFAECLHLVRVQSYKGFKGLCRRISNHFYNLIKSDINLMSQGDVRSAKRLVQAFAYTSRLSLNDIDLTQQMLSDYISVEENFPDEYNVSLVRKLNKVIRDWTESFDPSEILPRHGKRGIAELGRTSYEEKYKLLSSDMLLEHVFGEPVWCVDTVRPLKRTSKTIFVPKSYKTFRTISMEPTTLMYFQQGVWNVVDRMVRRNPVLRSKIDFHDQERNKRLAREGSIARNYATIDLSAASDSVSYKLVKLLFHKTKLLPYLMATRSRTTVLPNKQEITLKKFAPMGSALCFPVETLIFASVCEIVTREFRNAHKYSVYGDDIIVPTQCVESTVRILESLGFRVNREKSFHLSTCWFRESCGGEYCDGYDVTPMRVSRKYASLERGVRLKALIDSSNDAYVKGFRFLRSFFLLQLRRTGFTPLFAPTEILSDNYTNYHAEQRWNNYLQRLEVKTHSLDKRYRKKDIIRQDESIRYQHWLNSTADRNSIGDGFKSVICQPTESFHEVWRPKPFEASDQALIDFHVTKQWLNTRPLKFNG